MLQHEQAIRINQAFDDSGVGFKARRDEVLAALLNGDERQVTYDEAGNPYVPYSGVTMPLEKALYRFAHHRPELADGRTLSKDEHVGGFVSKEDLATPQAKAQFIRDFGLSAYEQLPLKSKQPEVEVSDLESFWALPRQEKIKLLAANPNIQQELPRRQRDTHAETMARINDAKAKSHQSLGDSAVQSALEQQRNQPS